MTLIEGATAGIAHNRDYWTPAMLTAAADAPRQTMVFTSDANWQIADVPIPPALYAAVDYLRGQGDTDCSFAIYDEELARWYNLYGVDYVNTTVSVNVAGTFDPAGSGWWDNTVVHAGRASGGAFAGGMIRKAELDAGLIPHALAIGLPASIIRSSGYSTPATATDGSGDATKIPMGQRFRLDPTLTTSQLQALGLLAAVDLIVAKAMQDYGAFLVDSADGFALYYESGLGNGATDYPATNPWPEAVVAYLQAMPETAAPVLDTPSTYGDVT